jgi:phosphate-selective porin OprO/OprP
VIRATRAILALVIVGVLALEGPARSQDSPQPAEVEAEEDTAEEAEREQEIAQEESQVLNEDAVLVESEEPTWQQLLKPRRLTIRWKQGLRIERNDGLFRLKVGARLEGDYASIRADHAIEDEIGGVGDFAEIRRAWVTLSGTIGKRVIYKVQVDVTGNSAGDDDRNEYLRQTFLGIRDLGPLGTVRIGYHKEPFSMNELNSSLAIPFMERALPAAFAPSYNPGISSQNHAFNRRMSWQFGLYQYTGADDSDARLDLTGRITALPVYADEGRTLLHLGISYSHQFRDGLDLRYRRRPESHLAERFVDTGEFATDGVNLYGLEVAAVIGSTTVQSELILSQVKTVSGGNRELWGGYIQANHFLTGEVRPYVRTQGLFGRVIPKHYVGWHQRGWGAWEIAARYSYVDLNDGDVRGGVLSDVSLGLNWHLRPHIRWMANYVHAHRNGLGDANIFQMRLAVDF